MGSHPYHCIDLKRLTLSRYRVWTYLPADAPKYHKGNSINLATSSLAFVLMVFAGLYVRWENEKRERGERDHRLEGKTAEEIQNLGYLHPRFRYQM